MQWRCLYLEEVCVVSGVLSNVEKKTRICFIADIFRIIEYHNVSNLMKNLCSIISWHWLSKWYEHLLKCYLESHNNYFPKYVGKVC